MAKELNFTVDAEEIKVKAEDLPATISSQIKEIEKLGTLIGEYDKSAQEAIKKVKQMTRFEEKKTFIFKHKSGDTKTIINDTQNAVLELTGVQQDTVEAIKKSFEYQAEIAKASSILFQTGAASIATTRLAIKAIQEKVYSGSKTTITSENARKELLNVLAQLKEQEDNYRKQQELTLKIKRNAERIEKLEILLEEGNNFNQQQKKEITELYNMIRKNEEGKSKNRFSSKLPGIALFISIIAIILGSIGILV